MADRYVNYDKLLEERHRLGLDESSKIHKVNAFNQFIDHLPTADVVPTAVMEQIKWERDIAIEQLASYGVCLGEKKELAEVVRCKDCKYVHINSSSGLYHCKRRGHYTEEVKPTDFCSYGEKKSI